MKISSYNYNLSNLIVRNKAQNYINANNSFNNTNYLQNENLVNFAGKYYAMTDTHSRIPQLASVLSEIENRRPNSEPAVFLDCGDYFGDSFSIQSIGDMYSTFQKRNPDVTCIMNMGNVDLTAFFDEGILSPYQKPILKTLKQMSDSGINFVSASYCMALEKFPEMGINIEKNNLIKPYHMLKDKFNGKYEDVLVTGVSEMKHKSKSFSKNYEKDALKYVKQIYTNNGIKPDKIILLLHDNTKNASEILKYAKEELKMDNILLVIGGHPHSIEDFEFENTRVLYPPAQGKGAYEIDIDNKGVHFEPLVLKSNHYDYSPLSGNRGVIDNSDINKQLTANPAYTKILENPKNSMFTKIITPQSPYDFEFRNYTEKYSYPTSLGTYISNILKDSTNADIGMVLNQFIREKLPAKGRPVTWYNICDTINLDANIYLLENVTVQKLKEIFECSLKKQDMGLSNPDFLEYSNNIRVTRKTDLQEGEQIVKQIEIKENGIWQKLLDESGNPIDDKKTFKIAIDSRIPEHKQPGFYDIELESFQIEDMTLRRTLADALQNHSKNSDEADFTPSEIINI